MAAIFMFVARAPENIRLFASTKGIKPVVADLAHPPIDKDNILVKVRKMSKVTSKLQVTLPKTIAEQLGIKPGDEISWEISGDGMRVTPSRATKALNKDDPRMRLQVFDAATRRQRQREKSFDRSILRAPKGGRGWTREQLYTRGGSDRH